MDIQQIQAWESLGIPEKVICRGIQQAFDTHLSSYGPEARPPHNMRYCLQAIEKEVGRYRIQSMGRNEWRPPPEGEQERKDGRYRRFLVRLEEALLQAENARNRTYYREACQAFGILMKSHEAEKELSKMYDAMAGLEDRLIDNLFEKLPKALRRSIEEETESALADRKWGMSERAFREALAFRRRTLTRSRCNLHSLMRIFQEIPE